MSTPLAIADHTILLLLLASHGVLWAISLAGIPLTVWFFRRYPLPPPPAPPLAEHEAKAWADETIASLPIDKRGGTTP